MSRGPISHWNHLFHPLQEVFVNSGSKKTHWLYLPSPHGTLQPAHTSSGPHIVKLNNPPAQWRLRHGGICDLLLKYLYFLEESFKERNLNLKYFYWKLHVYNVFWSHSPSLPYLLAHPSLTSPPLYTEFLKSSPLSPICAAPVLMVMASTGAWLTRGHLRENWLSPCSSHLSPSSRLILCKT